MGINNDVVIASPLAWLGARRSGGHSYSIQQPSIDPLMGFSPTQGVCRRSAGRHRKHSRRGLGGLLIGVIETMVVAT